MRQIDGYSLWLGNVGDVRDARALLSAGIGAVVDLAVNELPVTHPRELVHCRFPLVDGGGNPSWLLRVAIETVAALLRANVSTLVYCSAGMSRTPSIAAAAIALLSETSPADALARVWESGVGDVSPLLWADVLGVMSGRTR